MTGAPLPQDREPTRGAPEVMAPDVLRVVAANPSPMTHTGTASYLVGAREIAVIDPGPDDPAHVAALLAALPAGARITAILVTHTHRDHSPAAAALRAATGAPTYGFGPHGAGMSEAMRALRDAGFAIGGGEGADTAFSPDVTLGDGDAVTGAGWRLTAVHTPGHLSNHLCFALEGTGILFTGDHVMGWATTMISPPEGDMTGFMASLTRLRARGDRLFLPGHGPAVTDPAATLDAQFGHRRTREAQIIAELTRGPATPREMTRTIYARVDPRLWPAAERNVLAHLLGLVAEGRVAPRGQLSAQAVFALTR